jgi:predicted aldo/keto reductase-like oxidoreductase
MDIRNQAGTRGLKLAASRGTAVVVMEPILGGRLACAPEKVRRIWERSKTGRSPADWALQWLWNQPEVAVVLSGMSSLEQVRENIQSAEASAVGILGERELELVRQVRRCYQKLAPIPCTSCDYCMPCPHGVNIPQNLRIYNQGIMYENEASSRRDYSFVPEAARASACIQCRECEEKCPQKILISEWMPKVHASLGEGKRRSEADEDRA